MPDLMDEAVPEEAVTPNRIPLRLFSLPNFSLLFIKDRHRAIPLLILP